MVPFDNKTIFLVSGGPNQDLKAKSLEKTEYSVYQVDLNDKRVVNLTSMREYFNHCVSVISTK